jgi:hypothetical protein
MSNETDTPTRTVYWWTAEQLERAGWLPVDDTGILPGHYWCKHGSVYQQADHGGAWLPEPPPPEELSDKEIGDRLMALRNRGLVAASEEMHVRRWAADVIEAVHHAEQIREQRRLNIPTMGDVENIRQALRRTALQSSLVTKACGDCDFGYTANGRCLECDGNGYVREPYNPPVRKRGIDDES